MSTETHDELIRRASKKLIQPMWVLLAAAFLVVCVEMVWPSNLAVLWVLIFGGIGSLMNSQRRLQSLNESELHLLIDGTSHRVLAIMTGCILAFLFYLMCLGELITGSLFPKFTTSAADGATLGIRSIFRTQTSVGGYATLLVWSFLSGYSEGVVVNFLGSLSRTKIKPPESDTR